MPGTAAPFNFNGLVRHYYVRGNPEMGDVQLTLTRQVGTRAHQPPDCAGPARKAEVPGNLPEGTSVKVVEPPPGPPVLATLLAEIYGPDAETRRATAAKVREAFAKVPFVVDIDDSYGVQKPRLRAAIDPGQSGISQGRGSDVY